MKIDANNLTQVTATANAIRAYNAKTRSEKATPKSILEVTDKITLSDVAKGILSGKANAAENARALTSVDVKELRRKTKEAQRELRTEKKGRLYARFKALAEQLKILKKLYAANPKQMAKYLAGVAQELRKILKEYAAINKEAKADTPSSAAASLPQTLSLPTTPPGADASTAKSDTRHAPNEAEVQAASTLAAQTPSGPPPDSTAADEAKKDKEYAINEAKSDLSFAKEVRGFVQELKKLLQETKIKNFFNQDDPNEKEKLFKAANEVFKTLEYALNDFMKDVEKDIPPPTNDDAIIGGTIETPAADTQAAA
jgi:hypothetical protein